MESSRCSPLSSGDEENENGQVAKFGVDKDLGQEPSGFGVRVYAGDGEAVEGAEEEWMNKFLEALLEGGGPVLRDAELKCGELCEVVVGTRGGRKKSWMHKRSWWQEECLEEIIAWWWRGWGRPWWRPWYSWRRL
jgi:hypothetical protein